MPQQQLYIHHYSPQFKPYHESRLVCLQTKRGNHKSKKKIRKRKVKIYSLCFRI
uniref:Uncharacterized protein n=1 Tax=Arundo donax TaxID=35708 RepID=A0A0A9GYK6_ARUDO